jgi:nucleoid DNA-binding protein
MKKGILNISFNPRKVGFSGQTALVASVDRYSTIAYKDIVAYAAKAAAVPESSITMAMEAIYDALSYFVLNGHSVEVPNLGIFRLTVKCKAANTLEDFTAGFNENLRSVNIRFLPCSELKAQIASTSINAGVGDLTGYTSQAQMGVSRVFASYGSNVGELEDGDVVALSGLSQVVVNGTRLSRSFVGATPVSVTFVVPDGNGTQTMVLPAECIRQSYKSIAIDGRKLRALCPTATYLAALTVSTEGGTVVRAYTFSVPEGDDFAINSIYLRGSRVTAGDTIRFSTGETLAFTMNAVNVGQVAAVFVGNQEADITAIGQGAINFNYAPTATGNAPITVRDDEDQVLATFNVSFAEQAAVVPAITSITANGDPLVNGSTTQIVAGASYQLAVAGQNLNLLTANSFSVPQGTTLTITSQSASQLLMTIANTQAGTLACSYNGATLFSGTLVAAETGGVALTGWKERADGSTYGMSITNEVGEGINEVYLAGTGLDTLTAANFVSSSDANTVTAYDPATACLTYQVQAAGSIYVRVDGATVATYLFQVVQSSEGGDE